MFDLDALCPYLKEFKGDVIILTFKCIKLTTKNGCARLREEMAEMFEKKGFRVMRMVRLTLPFNYIYHSFHQKLIFSISMPKRSDSNSTWIRTTSRRR